MAYKSSFDKQTYTHFSKYFAAGSPEENTKWQKKAEEVFSNKYVLWKLSILEDQFVGACICYNRLKTRSEEYLTFSDVLSTSTSGTHYKTR